MTSTTYETLALEEQGSGVLVIRLNRPKVANALNTQMARDLHGLFDHLASGASEYRCLILTGAGPTFCSGADLKERRSPMKTGGDSICFSNAPSTPLSTVRSQSLPQ